MKEKELKKIVKEAVDKTILNESLSRIRERMIKHDTGFITAFRKFLLNNNGEEIEVTHKQNVLRNQQLFASLHDRYHITKVQGIYIENYNTPKARQVSEITYFVVDSDDLGSLESDLRSLGTQFDQDSILFVPKGADIGKIWGTNKNNPEAWPGYGNVQELNHPVFGKGGEFMTKVSGRPFIFTPKSSLEEQKKRRYQNWLSEMGYKIGYRQLMNKNWRDEK